LLDRITVSGTGVVVVVEDGARNALDPGIDL
jgi:hypothetical protein